MALIKCSGCGNKVSPKANACPKCGEPPPSPEELWEKTKNSLIGWGAIIGICLVLFIGNSVISALGSWREESKNEDYFYSNKEEILSTMQSHINQQNYGQALSLAKRYRLTKNGDLLALEVEAKDKKIRLDNKVKEEKLLEEVKKIPAKEFKKNKEVYAKLVSINPKEALYKRKHDYYQAVLTKQEQEKERLEAKREKEKKRLVAKFGRRPIVGPGFSGYNCPEIEVYLQQTAHDPDSIELENCTNVKRTRQGWLVGCTYRGRNGFGGVVKNANWFTIRHERVVKVDPSSSYSWQ